MAVRAITHSQSMTHSSPLFNTLEILDVHKLHRFLVSTFVYDLLHNNLPHSVDEYCNVLNYEYNTRQKEQNNLCVPTVKTFYGKQSMTYTGAVTWNSIQHSTRNEPRRQRFKSSLCKDLLKEYVI